LENNENNNTNENEKINLINNNNNNNFKSSLKSSQSPPMNRNKISFSPTKEFIDEDDSVIKKLLLLASQNEITENKTKNAKTKTKSKIKFSQYRYVRDTDKKDVILYEYDFFATLYKGRHFGGDALEKQGLLR